MTGKFFRLGRRLPGAVSVLLGLLAGAAVAHPTSPTPGSGPDIASGAASTAVSEVVVTASRLNLLGRAVTASEGSVSRKEVELRPIQRIGQIYETVPGLAVTVHSGEGKANQYLLRGFNLDHGTDFASFVDDMPVNRPTNTHGQGYSDQNFLMPQIISGVDYTKGPYYAGVGDFGAVGSARVHLIDDLPAQLSGRIGSFGEADVYAGGSRRFAPADRVWGAVDVGRLDGPWDPSENFRKVLAAARYSHGSDLDGFSLTGMYYQSAGRLLTDQPLRAVEDGMIGRFGTLDPTDASRSQRGSLSARYASAGEDWRLSLGVYAIQSSMMLRNDFTHFLFDPVNSDQEQQDETRTTLGGQAVYTRTLGWGPIVTETTFGLQVRYDDALVDRRHTKSGVVLAYCEAPRPSGPATPYPAVEGYCQADRARLLDLAPYVETTAHWTSWLRTVLGGRLEYYRAADRSGVTGFSGAADESLFQPKASIVLGPAYKTELYLSAGRGFHSDDVRGVFGTVTLEGVPSTAGKTPLLASATGEEVGLRSNIVPRLSLQLAVFREDFRSELAYDADQGQDSASAPSRREGVEVSGQYRPWPWIELNTDLAFSRARYRGTPAQLAAFGLDGPWIANAPSFIGSFGVLVDHLGPWSGGLQWRRLGAYPVAEGDEFPQDKGYSEFNLDVGYRLDGGLKLQLGVYNLLDEKADAAAYDYTSRLPGEPAQGVTGMQVHPLEPRSARLTVTKTF